jgi:ADP-ribose pyrophosphatase
VVGFKSKNRPENAFSMKEKTVISKRKFNGRLIKVDLLKVALANGRYARREIVRYPGAVAVLCRLPGGKFVLVRQFRKAIESALLEIVAGTREPGEGPAACARREVKEETGYEVAKLKLLGWIYSAPGFCDEKINIFFAELNSAGGQPQPDRDEQITLVYLSASRFETMLAAGKIRDAKTLAAWAMFRTRRHGKL